MSATVYELSQVPAVILAGGFGTRLRSVVPDRQKVIAEVKERPFLVYLFEQLSASGIRNAIVCIGHLGEQVKSAVGDSYGDIHITYSQEISPLGTAGAIRAALPFITSGTVLVMNGDSYFDMDLRVFWEWYCERKTHAALSLTEVPDTKRYGRVHLEENGRILKFEEKKEAGGPGWINAGIYLFECSLLENIPSGRPVSMEKEMFPSWISTGLYGFRSSGKFIDIGTPDSYRLAERFFESKTSS